MKISNKEFDQSYFEKIQVIGNALDFSGFRGEVGEELEADAYAKKFAESKGFSKVQINY